MPQFEFFCPKCQKRFTQILNYQDPKKGTCPHCHSQKTTRTYSAFFVGGRGDLRESTLHGCDASQHTHFPKKKS